MTAQPSKVLDSLQLSDAATAVGGVLHGVNRSFTGASMDSRKVAADELFVALPGTRVDGHDFLSVARERGAAAALVERKIADPLPQLVVADTRLALGRLAAWWRKHYICPVIGLTGSNGKTTVKELLAAILERCGATLSTLGNLNNDIGLPLTLLRLRSSHRYAVIEMGANHPGEIAYLTRITQPDVALINNAGPAHLEGFGTVEGVARAKGEIFSGLQAPGIAVINADDAYASVWEKLIAGHRCIRFGLSPGADIGAHWEGDAASTRLHIHTPEGSAHATLHLPGQHNVLNALAASAAALAVNVKLQDVALGLESARGAPGRLQIKTGRNDACIIDDTYNANPASVQAALNVLAACRGRRILVLGDLAELGGGAALLHRDIGTAAAAAGIDALYTVGELSAHSASVFGGEQRHFASQEELMTYLLPMLALGTTVLVKGSRSAHMERVVGALTGEA
ncbi:MAG: UDP-N-acetylmuramoyl-tripeptide--D-alanyl-D-alanine ligase [Gammaproteobacteria bacterium]|nr:UDP-N-acetylmuramoyl-tripeptide--D-alanyl-D-alanine ligase [Gammaproteobacteria bacterium]